MVHTQERIVRELNWDMRLAWEYTAALSYNLRRDWSWGNEKQFEMSEWTSGVVRPDFCGTYVGHPNIRWTSGCVAEDISECFSFPYRTATPALILIINCDCVSWCDSWRSIQSWLSRPALSWSQTDGERCHPKLPSDPGMKHTGILFRLYIYPPG